VESKDRLVQINMSGIPIAGVGGLGMVAVAIVMAYVLPEAWLFIAFGAIGGVALAIGLLMLRRYTGSHKSGPDDTHVLFRAETDRALQADAEIDTGKSSEQLLAW
jgi:hypothetical protein